ncbi:hypothetical protein CROQUDRAFT_92434 [Cronartium quercuum f. sp. fusiforme G11]|uniref:Uncharacterized protein n=1 Tax=Cronartium quercuum f. sp. fusiforme G11 TaxID=708437 RepID=A0A9P6TDE0_9BASI|nr:hypothetical protein CROQUDRAFT_92434 [Cronartium quercuum f. sp. fusiforme G11]
MVNAKPDLGFGAFKTPTIVFLILKVFLLYSQFTALKVQSRIIPMNPLFRSNQFFLRNSHLSILIKTIYIDQTVAADEGIAKASIRIKNATKRKGEKAPSTITEAIVTANTDASTDHGNGTSQSQETGEESEVARALVRSYRAKKVNPLVRVETPRDLRSGTMAQRDIDISNMINERCKGCLSLDTLTGTRTLSHAYEVVSSQEPGFRWLFATTQNSTYASSAVTNEETLDNVRVMNKSQETDEARIQKSSTKPATLLIDNANEGSDVDVGQDEGQVSVRDDNFGPTSTYVDLLGADAARSTSRAAQIGGLLQQPRQSLDEAHCNNPDSNELIIEEAVRAISSGNIGLGALRAIMH